MTRLLRHVAAAAALALLLAVVLVGFSVVGP